VPDFATFDQRGYPTVGAREGYTGWPATYEDTVEDEMDLRLLEVLEGVPWASAARAADLGCGTGRTGAWLRAQGVGAVEGIDRTPAVFEPTSGRGAHDRLEVGDVAATPFATGAYDVAVCSLVDEHLADLRPLYAEAARLLVPGGAFVLVGYHPCFAMLAGMPTHFDRPDGTPLAIETHLHLLSEHVAAARAAGLALRDLRERVVDDAWVVLKPRWERWRDVPVSFAAVWGGA
jgi:SAM-dependent methyltransferase